MIKPKPKRAKKRKLTTTREKPLHVDMTFAELLTLAVNTPSPTARSAKSK